MHTCLVHFMDVARVGLVQVRPSGMNERHRTPFVNTFYFPDVPSFLSPTCPLEWAAPVGQSAGSTHEADLQDG